MRRSNDVFFFTLVDFLLQVLFFGLVLFAYQGAREAGAADDPPTPTAADSLAELVRSTGVADAAELTDELTSMVPAKNLKELRAQLDSAGGLAAVRRMRGIVDSASGIDSLGAIIHRYNTGQDGYGKPPCNRAPDGRRPARVAVAIATDSTISFEARTPDFDVLLARLGRSFASVRTLRIEEFSQLFARVPILGDKCEYWLGFRERTDRIQANRAARRLFHLDYLAPR